MAKEQVTSFFVSKKGDFFVISFSGDITYHSENVMNHALEEVLGAHASYFVISLGDVSLIDAQGMRLLILLQKAIRDKGRGLRICNINNDNQKRLIGGGAIRDEETVAKITDAIVDFIKINKINQGRGNQNV